MSASARRVEMAASVRTFVGGTSVGARMDTPEPIANEVRIDW